MSQNALSGPSTERYTSAMPITKDEAFAKEVGSFYGEYLGTLTSPNGQVRADVFKDGGVMVAHVSFTAGLTPQTVTDPYLGDLKRFADQQGYSDRLRLVMSGNLG